MKILIIQTLTFTKFQIYIKEESIVFFFFCKKKALYLFLLFITRTNKNLVYMICFKGEEGLE